MGVPEPEEDDDAPVDPEDEGASTFLPLEFFDGGEMEPMPDALWEEAEARYAQGQPFCARSKFYSVDGGDALLPCEVVCYHPAEGKFEVQWVHTGKRKLCTRLNLLFDDESESKFYERVEKAKALRAAFEADARYFIFTTEQVGPNTAVSDLSAVLDEYRLQDRVCGEDEAAWQGAAMQESLSQLRGLYSYSMQRASADYFMANAAYRRTVAPLRLPTPAKAEVGESGTVPIPAPAMEYKDARACVAGALFAADPVLLRCFRLVADESYWLRETRCVTSPPARDAVRARQVPRVQQARSTRSRRGTRPRGRRASRRSSSRS